MLEQTTWRALHGCECIEEIFCLGFYGVLYNKFRQFSSELIFLSPLTLQFPICICHFYLWNVLHEFIICFSLQTFRILRFWLWSIYWAKKKKRNSLMLAILSIILKSRITAPSFPFLSQILLTFFCKLDSSGLVSPLTVRQELFLWWVGLESAEWAV